MPGDGDDVGVVVCGVAGDKRGGEGEGVVVVV